MTVQEASGEPATGLTIIKPDPDHRVIAGAVVAAAGLDGASPGEMVEVEFTAQAVTLWWSDTDENLVDREIPYGQVDFLRVSGRGEITTTTDAGLVGGGIGSFGGMAIANIVNSITRKTITEIETFVHLKARRTEVLLLETTTPPHILSVRLGPAFDLINDAQQRKMVEASRTPHSRSMADELAKLGELHRTGLLSADEFRAAKQRLLS